MPKQMSAQRKKSSPYAPGIAFATGAPESILAILENLMREEIFHSTLDWQSQEQLDEGARQAYDLYRSAPLYYDGIANLQRSEFKLATLERRLENARKSGATSRIADLALKVSLAREFVRMARESLPRLAAFHSPT
jgi:hypothetical protein